MHLCQRVKFRNSRLVCSDSTLSCSNLIFSSSQSCIKSSNLIGVSVDKFSKFCLNTTDSLFEISYCIRKLLLCSIVSLEVIVDRLSEGVSIISSLLCLLNSIIKSLVCQYEFFNFGINLIIQNLICLLISSSKILLSLFELCLCSISSRYSNHCIFYSLLCSVQSSLIAISDSLVSCIDLLLKLFVSSLVSLLCIRNSLVCLFNLSVHESNLVLDELLEISVICCDLLLKVLYVIIVILTRNKCTC